LAGFSEGDSNFFIHINSEKKVSCRYTITQKTTTKLGLDQKEIMEKIANFLKVNLNYKNKNNTLLNLQYSIQTASILSNDILISYFTKYPLFSSKYLNYLDWRQVCSMFKNKEHLLSEGLDKIISIKEGMNSKRAYFNWIHLDNFYASLKNKI
jgi:hypothetical protein